MKYKILIQIADFLSKFKKIKSIRRVRDCAVCITFDYDYSLIFDLDRSNSAIYKADIFHAKEYRAPFDIMLKKRFNLANIDKIEVLPSNRILKISATLNGSYKSIKSFLYMEFTGRFTNIIITDENNVILEALRHFTNSVSSIKVGQILRKLEPFDIKEGEVDIITDFSEFFDREFQRLKAGQIDALKSAKLANLDKKIEVLKSNLESLACKDELENKSKNLFFNANFIIANLYKLTEYDRQISLDNGSILSFTKAPKIAANDWFKEAKKLKQRAGGIEIQRQNILDKIAFLYKLKNALKYANSIEEINAIVPKKSSAGKKNLKNIDLVENFYMGDFKISLGKNEKGNALLLKESKKNDFWFHLQARPSAHVLVSTNKQTLSDEVIRFAAKVCVSFSVDFGGDYLVDYTKRMNVKIINGAFVNYVNYSTIKVKI